LIPPQAHAKFAGMIVALILTASTALSIDSGGQPPLPIEPLVVETSTGARHKFKAELAVTDEQMRIGMMFRTSAPAGTGMLFDYGVERPGVAFWMKNTLIPLDIIYVNAKGHIVRVVTAKPLDETPLPAGAPARAVLEIAGGSAAKLGIRAGDRVRHRIFGDKLP
jgi:uncharacterized membrane protein (UPF0127 family)